MFLRNFLLFILSSGMFYVFFYSIPTAYELFEKSSVFFVGMCMTYQLAKVLKKALFNKKVLPKNKAIFITGCDSGFGHVLAKRMDLLGYQVFAGCFNPEGEGAANLVNTCSSNLKVLPLDVTSDKSVEEARQCVKENLKGNVLWAVVNNAGIPQAGEMDWTSMEEIKAVCEVNTFGIVRVTKAFLHLLKASRGRIINNTSAVGRFICPGFVGYCMSKSAAIAFTEGLRIEMIKWGIKVISIEPFFYKTPLTAKETAIELAMNTWNKSDPDLQRDYGECYLESFISSCHDTVHRSSSKVYQVIECFEDAITAEEPEPVYFPAYLLHKIGIFCLGILPSFVKDDYQRVCLERGVLPSAVIKSG